MKLTNSMEQAVRLHLNEVRAESSEEDGVCWCPLCRADVMALALSSLPPRYATRRHGNDEIDEPTTAAIRDRVATAISRVQHNPKHQGGAAVAAGEPVWVVNFPLEESFRAVDEILRRHDGACDCWHCRCDMVAFALNRYPTRYGVEHGGRTHLIEGDREQMRSELAAFLDLAARVVTTIPRHELAAAGS